MLRNSEDHTIECLRPTVDHNAGFRDALHGCVQSNISGTESGGELLWYSGNAFSGHDHFTVRHGPPCEIGKCNAFRERWIEGDAGKKWLEYPLG